MRFCIFTDLHYDMIPDGDRRIQALLRDCISRKVDFILELGDLCHPTAENRRILQMFAEAGIPVYFSLGNHNTDFCPEHTALEFLGLASGHYSFVKDNVKFIVLHASEPDALHTGVSIPYEQLCWLEQELADDRYFYIICTHQSLANDFVTAKGKARGILNRAEVRAILERRNAEKTRVLLCLNGHEHGSVVNIINGIPYYTLNSASYFWQGVCPMYPYGPEIHQRYPYLKNMVLYREALHSIVTVDTSGVLTVEGMRGHYLTVGPQDIGMEPVWNGVSVLPETLSWNMQNL